MVGRTAPKTAAEKQRLDRVASLPCLPCLIDGWPAVPATVQHVTEARKRLGDMFTYPSCPWHHQGTLSGSVEATTKHYGPSLAHNPRQFAERYGAERELVQITDAMIRVMVSSLQRGQFTSDREWVNIAQGLHREIVLGKSIV